MLSPGFETAPITKGLCVCTIVAGVVGGFTKGSLELNVYPKIVTNKEVWRLFTGQVFFSSSSEIVLGALLLYSFRALERLFGSKKFAGFAVFLLLSSSLVQLAILFSSKDTISSFLPGPYALVFGLFCNYVMDVPRMWRFRVLGFVISDKTLIYLMGLQMFFSQGYKSIYPSVIGLVLGVLVNSPYLPFRKFRLPSWLVSCFQRLASSPQMPRAPGGQAYARVDSDNLNNSEGDAKVASLVSLGFDVQRARQALQRSGQSVEIAAQLLLES